LGADGSGLLGEVAGRVLAFPGVVEGFASLVDVWKGGGRGGGGPRGVVGSAIGHGSGGGEARGSPPNSNIAPIASTPRTPSTRPHADSRLSPGSPALNAPREPESGSYDDPIVAVAAFAGTVLGTA